MKRPHLPQQRWQIAPAQPAKAQYLVEELGLSPLLAQVVINRGIEALAEATIYLDPEQQRLKPPRDVFTDLTVSVGFLVEAITDQTPIAICGDYDADGMTSTALLLRGLKHLGAIVDYAIPSRMQEGYGINERIVTEFAEAGVGVILTVDNGISAIAPIKLAVELGLTTIITDHHDLPPELPPADAILNPKLIPPLSPYAGLAGVGVAYLLALETAQQLGKAQEIQASLLELFTLGTIADLAPLVGVNRRWLRTGLRQLPQSQLAGIQALMQVAGISEEQKQLQPDDIGFRLGPRINAVGRLADPQIVIEMLTTDEPGLALERAMQCEAINKQRQQLCTEIEADAIALIEKENLPWREDRVLVVVKSGWHHGVIGIVASRLVERYGVPTFIASAEEDGSLRGSARSIPEFDVFEALNAAHDVLGKYGGHRAAGGFSLPADNLDAFRQRLRNYAWGCLDPSHLYPLVKIDAQATLADLTEERYHEIADLHPWGIGNELPIFWSPNVQVLEQRRIGKNHLKVTLADDSQAEITAIAWRWGDYYPLPNQVDIAYKLRENHWRGKVSVELELVGARLSNVLVNQSPQLTILPTTQFTHQGVAYTCRLESAGRALWLEDRQGNSLLLQRGQARGTLQRRQQPAETIDVTRPPFFNLVRAAVTALQTQPTVKTS
ncbi:MAG: single-stranded-DNA-specific exonuclease RecJ [Cyanobacteria bacterium P01_H01_bin.15]